jgi:hypothetical protein
MLFFAWITRRTTITDEYNNKTKLKMEFDSITKRLIFVSIAFVIATLPSSILNIFYKYLSKTSYGFNLIHVANILMFAYHGLNFSCFLFIYKATLNKIGFFNF